MEKEEEVKYALALVDNQKDKLLSKLGLTPYIIDYQMNFCLVDEYNMDNEPRAFKLCGYAHLKDIPAQYLIDMYIKRDRRGGGSVWFTIDASKNLILDCMTKTELLWYWINVFSVTPSKYYITNEKEYLRLVNAIKELK